MFHIQITVYDEKNNIILADVLASCTELTSVPRTLNTLLKVEPILSVTNGSQHAPVTLPSDSIHTPRQKTKRAAKVVDEGKRLVNLSRRNQSYVEPLPHMVDTAALAEHERLLGYLNTMPSTIPGIDNIRTNAHRKWFAWYDRGITMPMFTDWIAQTMLTVRQWHAEHLMARAAAHDFAGQTIRADIQRLRSGLLAGRIKPDVFDSRLATAVEKLAKLTGPVNAKAH